MKSGLIVFAAVLLCLLPRCSPAQTPPTPTSIGFADPTDLGALLRYRLPDWGYRTTSLSLNGFGRGSNEPVGELAGANLNQSSLHRRYRESEHRTWTIDVGQSLDWDWREQEGDTFRAIESRLHGRIALEGTLRDYLSQDVSILGASGLQVSYSDLRLHADERRVAIRRGVDGSLRFGAGLGRIRDVTPLFRALRMNERLQALGRQPLPGDGVTRLAAALARRGGYLSVFDRPDRHFWRDVLEPLAGGGTPLSPFEVFYLTEATIEDLGSRREGHQFDAGVQLGRAAGNDRSPSDTYGPWLTGAWSRNLSLNHQLSANFNARYFRFNPPSAGSFSLLVVRKKQVNSRVSVDHLWIVADRVSWRNSLLGLLLYEETDGPLSVGRWQEVQLNSQCSYVIEDRLRLVPQLALEWRRTDVSGRHVNYQRRIWQILFGLQYDLTNALF